METASGGSPPRTPTRSCASSWPEAPRRRPSATSRLGARRTAWRADHPASSRTTRLHPGVVHYPAVRREPIPTTRRDAMPEKGRLAVFHGTGKPFEIREYPVPEPEPGAIVIRIALANICGSDMHYWRGEQNYERMGRPLPLNTGHEHV